MSFVPSFDPVWSLTGGAAWRCHVFRPQLCLFHDFSYIFFFIFCRMQAAMRMSDMKLRAMEGDLEKKKEEIAELTKIVDDLISKDSWNGRQKLWLVNLTCLDGSYSFFLSFFDCCGIVHRFCRYVLAWCTFLSSLRSGWIRIMIFSMCRSFLHQRKLLRLLPLIVWFLFPFFRVLFLILHSSYSCKFRNWIVRVRNVKRK